MSVFLVTFLDECFIIELDQIDVCLHHSLFYCICSCNDSRPALCHKYGCGVLFLGNGDLQCGEMEEVSS